MALMAILLVAYNTALNLLVDPGWFYVPANVAAAVALLVVARTRGLDTGSIGLSTTGLADSLTWGVAVVAVVAVGVLAAVALQTVVPVLGRLLADRRAAGLTGGQLAYQTLVRIPLGTVVLEELAFRGVLLAAVTRTRSTTAAVAVSSLVFGLWHVGPAVETLRVNQPAMVGAVRAAAVGVVVVGTALGGVALSLLRLAGGSLLVPALAHWAVNALGLLAAAGVQRPS